MNAVGPTGPEGITTTVNGEQYYIIGKTRIKITEHFSSKGKPIDELVTGLIINKIRENAGKSA